MIDSKAPILPWEGLGGIKLYSTFRDVRDIIEDSKVKAVVFHNIWVRYEIEGMLYIFFHLLNGKIFKLTALRNYKGKLFERIGMGMTEKELLMAEPSFIYDDFEEVFESPKGIYIVTNAENRKVEWISVFVREIDDEGFEEGNW